MHPRPYRRPLASLSANGESAPGAMKDTSYRRTPLDRTWSSTSAGSGSREQRNVPSTSTSATCGCVCFATSTRGERRHARRPDARPRGRAGEVLEARPRGVGRFLQVGGTRGAATVTTRSSACRSCEPTPERRSTTFGSRRSSICSSQDPEDGEPAPRAFASLDDDRVGSTSGRATRTAARRLRPVPEDDRRHRQGFQAAADPGLSGARRTTVDEYMLTRVSAARAFPEAADFVWYAVYRVGPRVIAVKPERGLSYRGFYEWWRRVEDTAGVRHRKPHMTRHTFATDVLDATEGDLYAVKELLGHSSSTKVTRSISTPRGLAPKARSGRWASTGAETVKPKATRRNPHGYAVRGGGGFEPPYEALQASA